MRKSSHQGPRRSQLIFSRADRQCRRIDGRRICNCPDLRQSEVENLGVLARGHEDVRRLDVAMGDPGGMRCVQTLGNLYGERKQSLTWYGLSQNAMLQSGPIQELHDDEGAVLVALDLVYRANIRVVQGGGCARLPPKPLDR